MFKKGYYKIVICTPLMTKMLGKGKSYLFLNILQRSWTMKCVKEFLCRHNIKLNWMSVKNNNNNNNQWIQNKNQEVYNKRDIKKC